MKKFLEKYNRISNRNKAFVMALLLLLLHALLSLYFVISGLSSESSGYPMVFVVFGCAIFVLEIAFAIFSRIKLNRIHLTGFFIYGLVGMLFFTIALIEKLANGEAAGGFFQSIFNWYTIMVRPVSYILSPLIGMSEFYRKGIVFGLIVVIFGSLSSSAGKEIKFINEKNENMR